MDLISEYTGGKNTGGKSKNNKGDKSKHKTHYKKKHCSPFKKKLPYSCLSHKSLLNVAKALNKIKDITINHKGLSD